MKIRKAIEADYEPLMQLYNGFVGENRYSGLNNDSFKKVLESSKNYIYVAEEDNQLVGFSSFSIRSVVRYPKQIAELDEIYVRPEYRKKGVGKLLMDKVLEEAKNQACYRLFIESHYDHKDAHKFYERLGFTNYGYHFIKNL